MVTAMQGSYAPGLVAASVVIAIMAAYTAITVARRIASASDRASYGWLIGGAFAMGTGIWSMHFLGMLAFRLPIAMGYAPGMTTVSWLIAVVASLFALWLTARARLGRRLLALGALVMGAGICGMHYSGMAAMHMQPAIDYDWWLVGLSGIIAVAVSGVGLFLIHTLRAAQRHIRRLHVAAALVIGVSIVGMHYTAMAAAQFPAGSLCGAAARGLHGDWLAVLIGTGALGVLTLALAVSVLDQRMESRTAVLAASLARANSELSHLALHDALTGLPNRRLLEDRLTQAIARNDRFALVFVDLDGFKTINDVFGHHAGDLLLVEVARRLDGSSRKVDTVSRQGGDEFVLLVHAEDRGEAETIARRLLGLIREPFDINRRQLTVSASLGVALYPEHGADAAALLSNADAAMYHAKEHGRSGWSFFEASMNAHAQLQMELTQAMASALTRGEFHLVYQPKFNAGDHRLVGVEALARWNHPGHGAVGPDTFIPLAERSGFIIELGRWVLHEACRQLAVWCREGKQVQMSVNLSTAQFRSPGLVDEIEACLTRYTLPPNRLILEITESMAMEDVEHSHQMLQRLRALGLMISIDDFGTGYSSLVCLKRLLATELKIDRAFVNNLQHGDEDSTIVTAIIALGKALGFTVTAEGVETVAQRDFLTRQGCDLLQGYLLGRPVAPAALRWDAAPPPRVAHLQPALALQ